MTNSKFFPQGRGDPKTRCIMLLFLLVLLGCARAEGAPDERLPDQLLDEPAIETLIAEDQFHDDPPAIDLPAITARYAVIPPNARPGEPVTVGYSDYFGDGRVIHAVLLDSRRRRLTRAVFFNVDTGMGEPALKAAIFAIPSTALIGNAFIRIESGEDQIAEIPFFIDHRDFRSETIALNPTNTALRTEPDPQRTAESQQLWTILNRTGTGLFDRGPFQPPVTSTRRTSLYGSRRVYEYSNGTSDTAIHAGVDYGVPTGTEVRACATGRVVLARYRILTGYTVILEHLPGIYSLYYHMDSIAAEEGSIVEAGAFLGPSGATGLATGPHLHWEIRVAGENADPDAFLSRPILDKNEIINKLRTL